MTLAAWLCVATALGAGAPVELGRVNWLRDLEKGIERSEATDRPVLLLFQEVPGCSTCVDYGSNVLSHPLVVEAIETLFVPVAAFNNTGGDDHRVLRSFKEPAWNNPVVRIIDSDRNALAPRLSGDYTRGGLVDSMMSALIAAGQPVPAYLKILQEEFGAEPRATETGVFAMPCFWTGESRLGGVTGVLATRPGFLHGEEVVEVAFDPAAISYAALLDRALEAECAGTVFTRTDRQQQTASAKVGRRAVASSRAVRPDGEPKYYLAQTRLRAVPMTDLQAARVNAAIGLREDPEQFLSPRQRGLHKTVRMYPAAGWTNAIAAPDVVEAWDKVMAVAASVSRLHPSRIEIVPARAETP